MRQGRRGQTVNQLVAVFFQRGVQDPAAILRARPPSVCALPLRTPRVQVGVTSWGEGCAGPKPGVYADVASVRGWIDSTIKASWDAFTGRW